MKQRKDGRWCKVITLNGKRVYFYSTESTEKKAEKDIMRQILTYEEKEERGKTFDDVADEWDRQYREKIPDWNYNKNIRAAFDRIYTFFAGRDLKEITAVEVNIFINQLIIKCYSKKTIANHKSVLNMIFNYAVVNGYIRYNPVRDIRLPNNLPKSPRKMPSTDELKAVLSHHKGFDFLPFFMLLTGCRKSEALGITDKSVDLKNRRIHITHHVIHSGNRPIFEPVLKTESAERDVIILDKLYEVFPRKFKGFLFSMNGDGKEPLTSGAYDCRWESYCKRYNLNITAHQLRHGYATMLFEAGIDEKDAQELMGHSDINLTRQIYTHIRTERKTETEKKLNAFSF
ncbi:MAG: site-specific integrase [Oscillospiraceae bacterium]|nr:site-specific integrase [Oscillospiraceae bacterium]